VPYKKEAYSLIDFHELDEHYRPQSQPHEEKRKGGKERPPREEKPFRVDWSSKKGGGVPFIGEKNQPQLPLAEKRGFRLLKRKLEITEGGGEKTLHRRNEKYSY